MRQVKYRGNFHTEGKPYTGAGHGTSGRGSGARGKIRLLRRTPSSSHHDISVEKFSRGVEEFCLCCFMVFGLWTPFYMGFRKGVGSDVDGSNQSGIAPLHPPPPLNLHWTVRLKLGDVLMCLFSEKIGRPSRKKQRDSFFGFFAVRH